MADLMSSTCKDCMHFEACSVYADDVGGGDDWETEWREECERFKDNNTLFPKLKPYPFEHFNMNAPKMKFENDILKIQNKIYAECVDMKDQEILGAIIRAADEAGVTELYLLDKQFVMDALEAALEKWRADNE